MSQPSLDLPDPTETQAAAPPEATDDLLSQLAGNEIDRLLADAGIEPTPAERPATSSAPAPAPSMAPSTGSGVPQPMPPAVPAASDGPIAKELDQVFNRQLSEAAGPGGLAASPTPEQVAADASAVATLLDGIESGERPRRPEAGSGDATAATAEDGKATTPTSGDSQPLSDDTHAEGGDAQVIQAPIEVELKSGPGKPLLVSRLLSILAVPLDPFPDRVRDAVGKVAIVTTLNAIAVLVYVLFFKK